MKGQGSRRRRWFGATLATLALGALAAPAGALQLNTSTDTRTQLSSSVHFFNDARPVTLGNYQIVAYWQKQTAEGDAPLKITRRKLSDGTLQHKDFTGDEDYYLPWWSSENPARTLTTAISPADGRIHVLWGQEWHSSLGGSGGLRWVRSSSGCMSQSDFNNCSWIVRLTLLTADEYEFPLEHRIGEETDTANEPTFFNGPDGDLYLTWRNGDYGAGNQILSKYENDATWTRIGRILGGWRDGSVYPDPGNYDPDGAGSIPNSDERSPHVFGIQIDRNERMHVMWSWRHSGAYSGTAANEGVYYAYSDDDGATWRTSGGAVAGSTEDFAMDIDTAGLRVANLPYGSHHVGTEMELDSHNQPHAVLPASDVTVTDPRDTNIRQKHIWRTTNGSWHEDWIDSAGTASRTYGWGDLFFDRHDIAYYIYNENNLGWSPVTDNQLLRREDATWQPHILTGGYMHIRQRFYVTEMVNNDHADTAISTTGVDRISIRLRNGTDGIGIGFWWTTDASPAWSSSKSATFEPSVLLRGWETYTFEIDDADWRGNLQDLRIQFLSRTLPGSGDYLDIDWIRLEDAAGGGGRTWNFDVPSRVVAAEADPSGNWPTWNQGTLLAETNTVWSDAGFQIDAQRYADGSGDTKRVNFPVLEQGVPGAQTLSLREFDIIGDTVLKFWNFDVDTQGWTATNHVSGLRYAEDAGANSITGTITGNDSRVMSPDNLKVRLEASAPTLHVRLKNGSTATQAAVCFITDADTTWNAGKCKTFAITANSGYTNYTVDMSTFSQWTSANRLRRLRIDPADNASSGTFHLHRVYIAP